MVITCPSQRAEIVGHVAELSDHPGVAEIPGSGVAGAAERDRADVKAAMTRSDLS
jgi:hypothetical protein